MLPLVGAESQCRFEAARQLAAIGMLVAAMGSRLINGARDCRSSEGLMPGYDVSPAAGGNSGVPASTAGADPGTAGSDRVSVGIMRCPTKPK